MPYNIYTPHRRKSVRQLARRTYKSVASTMVTSSHLCKPLVLELSRKCKAEMKELASDKHDSILRDTREAVRHFSWETVMREYERKIPTLVSFLKEILPKPEHQRSLLCLLLSVLVKSRHQRLCLVQRAISVMLYGHGSSKQVKIVD